MADADEVDPMAQTLEVGGTIRVGSTRAGHPRARWQPGTVTAWVVPALVAFVASVAWSWVPGLWTDEDATVSAATRSTPDLLHLTRSGDAVQGLYDLLVHAWVGAVGVSPFLLRLPSAVVTAVAAAGVVLLARRLTGRVATAMAAGLAYAVLPIVSYYGMEAGPAAFGAAAAVWASWALVRALDDRAARWWWYAVLLGVGSALDLHLLLLVPAHLVTVALARPARATVLRWAAACLLAAGIAAPVVALAAGGSALADATQTRWSQLPQQAVRLWFEDSRPVALVAWALVALGVWSALRSRRGGSAVRAGAERLRGGPRLLALTVPWLVLPPLVTFAVSTVQPHYAPRYSFFCVPALALLLGAGITALRSRPVGIVLLALLLLVGLRTDLEQRRVDGKGDDVVAVDRVLAGAAHPGDAVLYRPDSRRLAAIGDPSRLGRLDDIALDRSAVASDTLWGTDVGRTELVGRLSGVQRVWVVDRPGAHGPGGADVVRDDQALATAGYRQLKRWRTGHSEVQLLVRGTR